ncbi:MAG: asparagine synthetase B, partial [Ruminococcus sp.]|nr:asparagine synthetase B [Ruminococcus sp.]
FIRYCDIANVKQYSTDTLETACKNIREKLVAGVEKRLVSDAKVGFLLSGGLDSSLVCAIAAKCSDKPIRTFAIGMDIDAIDLKYAKKVAEYIGSEHTEVIITKEDVLNALEEVIRLLGTYDITTIRASIGMYLVCKAIHEQTDIRVLLTGEISDELFGYKYTDFAPDAESFQKEAQKRIRELHMYDVLRADRCISVNSLEARVPFGDLDFVRYVMSLNPEMKMNVYQKGKYLLRHAFEGEYLPDDILWREKAAFSDAVGHSMVDDLKAYAEAYYSDETFKRRQKKYSHAQPFTKESLLYREIFEKYYPEQSEMITDFWMPNKEWKGCNVSDPSARVLSNYGDSGK